MLAVPGPIKSLRARENILPKMENLWVYIQQVKQVYEFH
jgi:hypothetical protein